jgi:hypothetical protein
MAEHTSVSVPNVYCARVGNGSRTGGDVLAYSAVEKDKQWFCPQLSTSRRRQCGVVPCGIAGFALYAVIRGRVHVIPQMSETTEISVGENRHWSRLTPAKLSTR